MKNLILILLATFSLSCCSKDDNKSSDQLPAATTTGANTAGCLVNGQVFLPKGSSQFGPTLSCFYQQDQGGYHFSLSINDKKNKSLYKTVQFATNPIQLVENTTYLLGLKTNNGSNYNSNFGEYYTLSFDGDKYYQTTNIYIGELKITKLDTQHKIISGTFWYDVILSGEKIEIREGRFDMHYVN
jgi:hypothetical protein